MRECIARSDLKRIFVRILLSSIVMLLVAGCGVSFSSDDEPETNAVIISVASGNFTTTIRPDDETEIPFSETIVVEAQFENAIYGSAGQTAVFAEVSPSDYRIESRPRLDDRTFVFALLNRSPGTAEVSIYESRNATPVTFTLEIVGN